MFKAVGLFSIVFVVFYLGFRYAYVPYLVKHSNKTYDFSNLTLPDSPNYYLSCPSDFSSANAVPSRSIAMSIEKLEQTLIGHITNQPRVQLIQRHPSIHQYIFVQYSFFWHFPDIIVLQFIPISSEHSTYCIYSRSLVGYSDFSVNKKRVTDWLNKINY